MTNTHRRRGPPRTSRAGLGLLGSLLLLPMWGACSVSAFICSNDGDCGSDGACEPQNVCSFPDPSCPSGRRYGLHSGFYADECTPRTEPDTDTPSPSMTSEGEPSSRPLTSTDGTGTGTGTGGVDSSGTSRPAIPTTSTRGAEHPSDSSSTGPGPGEGETTGQASSTGTPAEPCDDLYGTVAGYLLCEDAEGSCRFYAQTNGSCDDLCASFGGVCLAAFREVDDTCEIIEEIGCGSDQGDQICECSS